MPEAEIASTLTFAPTAERGAWTPATHYSLWKSVEFLMPEAEFSSTLRVAPTALRGPRTPATHYFLWKSVEILMPETELSSTLRFAPTTVRGAWTPADRFGGQTTGPDSPNRRAQFVTLPVLGGEFGVESESGLTDLEARRQVQTAPIGGHNL